MKARAATQLALVCLLALPTLTLSACKRRKPPIVPKTEAQQTTQPRSATPVVDLPPGREVNAAWYDVPISSLAKKRAGLEELTAAHNTLPLGTRVRLTHLTNGKSVVVRITDRGIKDRKVKIDVCKEAARELDMVGEGIARVRMQVLPEGTPGGNVPSGEVAAQQ